MRSFNITRQRVARIALVAMAAGILLQSGCAGPTGAAGAPAPPDRAVALAPSNDEPRVVTVSGLDTRALNAFDALEPERRQTAVEVRVAQAPPGSPPLLGEVARQGAALVFTPRYPFQPGLKYHAQFDPTIVGATDAPVVSEFTIPAPSREPVTRVAAIYPSADQLPENLLKFYIHFSAPMSRGEAYRRIKLLDENGQPVDRPFLELGEELWNPEMTRFTLFFEPGRIKQGLVPRLEMGPALTSGRTYTLVIDPAWQDAQGRPLIEPSRKTFKTTPADARQPDPKGWRITLPPAGSTEALTIVFDEPLDHAMLQRVLSIRDPSGRQLPGKITIAEHERRWSFTPDAPWPPGRHVVVVDTILEDAAGNSIGRPFEVNLNQGSAPAGPAEVEIPFDVRPGN